MDDQKYVTRLMRARCSCGTIVNYLNIGRDHGILVGADMQPLMNANDHVAGVNIIHFGNCKSDKNPERMFRKGLVSLMASSTVPGMLIGLVTKDATFFGDHLTDSLEALGIMACKCKPNTPNPWEITNEDSIVEGAPALMTCSTLTCRYGGVIEIVDPDDEKIDIELQELREKLNELLLTTPWDFGQIADVLLQMTCTDTGNAIERELFDINKDWISKILAFEYAGDAHPGDEAYDFYRTNENYGVQRIAGFMDLWDEMGFLLGMNLDTEIVTFEVPGRNKEYRLQFWKGSYGFGTAFGGEIGFYSRNSFWTNWLPYKGESGPDDLLDNYLCVSGKDELKTIQEIFDANTGNPLIYNSTDDYADKDDHFWNLAIKTNAGYSSDDLVVMETVYSPDKEMYDAMVAALKENEKEGFRVVSTDDKEMSVVIQYGTVKEGVSLGD